MQHRLLLHNEDYEGLNPLVFGYENCTYDHSDGPSTRYYWLLHYVVSGKGIFRLKNKTYYVNPGEIFSIPPHEEYFYQADRDDPWEYIWIGFSASSPLPIDMDPIIRCPAAEKIFLNMKKAENMDIGRCAYLSGMLWELMSTLLENTVFHYSDYVKKALEYINKEFSSNITIGEIADRININRSYLFTLFRKETGLSPQKYLYNLRMEHARTLLVDYDKLPTEVAFSIGYTDISQFSKAFKKYYGVSPRKYLKNMKKSQ